MLWLIVLVIIQQHTAIARRPNILVFIADDLGWNDVGFHGSNQIRTPNIDALAYNGVIFDRHYTLASCTPSRAAFLTGQYPMRFGYQGDPIAFGHSRTIPKDLKTLPGMLKQLGYNTYLIGKWHLGAGYRNDTPIGYGYDMHYGYWGGFIGYYDHVAVDSKTGGVAIDLHENLHPIVDKEGECVTELLTQRAIDVIRQQDKDKPFFMVVSHLAAHTGFDLRQKKSVLEVKNINETRSRYFYIKDERRQMFAEIIEVMDASIGSIISVLNETGQLDDTIVVFFSDNGAPTYLNYSNSGSNYPLRGAKMSYYEGGIRVPALIYHRSFGDVGRIYKKLFHITDWVPTLYKAAGGTLKHLGILDGINHWENIKHDLDYELREDLLVDIDDKRAMSAFIGYRGRYKLIKNSDYNYNYSGDAGRYMTYDTKAVLNSVTSRVLLKNDNNHKVLTEKQVINLRRTATLRNCRNDAPPVKRCTQSEPCLFDLANDPCELVNLAERQRAVFQQLWLKIKQYEKMLRPQVIATHLDNVTFNHTKCNGTWYNWLEPIIAC